MNYFVYIKIGSVISVILIIVTVCEVNLICLFRHHCKFQFQRIYSKLWLLCNNLLLFFLLKVLNNFYQPFAPFLFFGIFHRLIIFTFLNNLQKLHLEWLIFTLLCFIITGFIKVFSRFEGLIVQRLGHLFYFTQSCLRILLRERLKWNFE